MTSNSIRKILHPHSDTWFNMLCLVPCSMYGVVRNTYGIRSEFPSPVCEDVGVGLVCYPCALSRAARDVGPLKATTMATGAVEGVAGAVEGVAKAAKAKVEEMKGRLPGLMK